MGIVYGIFDGIIGIMMVFNGILTLNNGNTNPWEYYKSMAMQEPIDWRYLTYKAYFLGLCMGIYHQNMANNMVR